MIGFPGSLDEPWAWTLEEVGRMLLRVRTLDGSAPDKWYVLVPETSQNVDVGGTTVTVTTNIVFSGNEDVGLAVSLAGAGADGVDMTVFVNVGSANASWAYAGVVADAQPLPPSLAFKLTTPASAAVSATHTAVTARIDDTNDGSARRVVRLGRADIPTSPVTATVSLTPAALAAAAAALAAHGLSLTGLPLPAGGAGTVTVQAPSADTGPAAFGDPAITSMTDASATFSAPGGGALGTGFWQVTVDQEDNSAAGQPSTTSVTWGASEVFDVGVLLAAKDPAVRLGLTGRTSLVSATTTRLPSALTAVLATMPDIVFGGPSPDPAAAAPALDYSANGRLAKLDLVQIAQSTALTPPPPGGTPPPNSSLRAVAEDIPRRVVVRAGQWNPNHPDDTFLELHLFDEQGNVDTLAHLSATAGDSALPVTPLTPSNDQQLTRDAALATRQADLLGIRALTLRVEPRAASMGLHVHYLAADARTASIRLVDADLGSTLVTATPLPTEVTIDAQMPDITTLANAQASWSGTATWLAAAAIPDLTVVRAAAPGASGLGIDEVALTARVADFPRDVTVTGGNDGSTQVTGIQWLADTRLSSASVDVDIVRYSQPGAPFFDATATITSFARATSIEIMRATPGVDITYGASDAVATVDVRVRNTALVTQRPAQFVPFDHARTVLTGIPGTAVDPQAVTAGPRLTFRLDTAAGQGLVALVDVPAGVEPIGQAHVQVVDNPSSDVADFTTPAGVRWVNRPNLGTGQDELPGAPVGSEFTLTLPELRSALYDGRDGQVMPTPYTIARALQSGENAFGVEVHLDSAVPFSAELAMDEPGSLSSTWISGTLSSAGVISLDGQLAGSTANGHHIATEILPVGPQVEAVMHRYDRDPAAAPTYPSDSVGMAADRLARSTRARLLSSLPGRLDLRLDSPHARLDGVAEMRPVEWFDLSVRRGAQLVPGPAAILSMPGGTATELSAWVSFQHGFADELELWKTFIQDPRPRADYVVRRDTSVTIIPGAPEPQREVQTTGVGPSTLLTNAQIDSVVLARFDRLRGLEASGQIGGASPGSRRTRRVVALWASEDWEFGIRALRLENGQATPDLIEGGLTRLGPKTQLLLTPEAWNTENGLLRLTARVMLHQASTELVLRGGWERGFPRAEWPTETPALTADPSQHRPAGLTALDLAIRLAGWLELHHERHWEPAPDDQPQYEVALPLFRATETWRLHCPRGLDIHAWALRDRPHRSGDGSEHPFVGWLSGAVAGASAPSVSAIQGGVRYPEYGPGASEAQVTGNPWFMRPGEAAAPHSGAVALDGLTDGEVSGTKLSDDEGREVPVFVSDDSASWQTGATATSGKLSLANQAGPGTLDIVAWEVDDWQDSPQLELYQALGVNLDSGTPERVAWAATSQVRQLPGKRPMASSSVTVSTSGDVNDTSGPDLGPGSLTLRRFDTGANPWAPLITTVAASLTQAPGFVRLRTGKFVEIGQFPDGSLVGLPTGGWDRAGAFGSDQHSTAQVFGWASGALAGTITTTGADFRRSKSAMPSSFARSPRFDMTLVEASVSATPSGPVDLARPPFAMVTSASGPPGNSDGTPNDDTSAGLGLYAARNLLTLDGTIRAAALYGRSYTATEPPPSITVDDDPLTLTLTDFTGRLTVNKRSGLGGTIVFLATQTLSAALITFAAISWVPGVGIIFAVTLAELGLIVLLNRTSPIIVDDCGGSWYLHPRPSTDLSVLRPYVNGWRHDEWPSNWVLHELIFVFAVMLLLDYVNTEYGGGWLARELEDLL